MTPNEINAWARIANIRSECAGHKVVIKRDDGKYLSRSRDKHAVGPFHWSDNRELAYIYDFDKDRVGDQIQEVQIQYKAKWTVEVIPAPTMAMPVVPVPQQSTTAALKL